LSNHIVGSMGLRKKYKVLLVVFAILVVIVASLLAFFLAGPTIKVDMLYGNYTCSVHYVSDDTPQSCSDLCCEVSKIEIWEDGTCLYRTGGDVYIGDWVFKEGGNDIKPLLFVVMPQLSSETDIYYVVVEGSTAERWCGEEAVQLVYALWCDQDSAHYRINCCYLKNGDSL